VEMSRGRVGTGWITGDRLNAEAWADRAPVSFARFHLKMGIELVLPDRPEADAGRRAADLSNRRKEVLESILPLRLTARGQRKTNR